MTGDRIRAYAPHSMAAPGHLGRPLCTHIHRSVGVADLCGQKIQQAAAAAEPRRWTTHHVVADLDTGEIMLDRAGGEAAGCQR